MTRQLYTLLLVLAAVCGACSDDDDPGRDGGSLDRAVGPDADQGSAADLDPSRKKFESRIPGNNAVPGWVEDTTVGKVGVEAGYTKKAIEAK